MRISLDTKRVQNDEINSSIFRSISEEDLVDTGKNLSYKFDFYNMADKNSSLSRADLDGLVYDSVTVNVLVDGESKNFSFKIKNYHEIVNYKMLIGKKDNIMWVRVFDADYEMKKEIFRE